MAVESLSLEKQRPHVHVVFGDRRPAAAGSQAAQVVRVIVM
jgi:hypothetical protein